MRRQKIREIKEQKGKDFEVRKTSRSECGVGSEKRRARKERSRVRGDGEVNKTTNQSDCLTSTSNRPLRTPYSSKAICWVLLLFCYTDNAIICSHSRDRDAQDSLRIFATVRQLLSHNLGSASCWQNSVTEPGR